MFGGANIRTPVVGRVLRLVAALGIGLAVSGCLGEGTGTGVGTGGGFGFLKPNPAKSAAADPGKPARSTKWAKRTNRTDPALGGKAMKTVALAAGKVVVTPPRGYCIDATALKKGLAGGFALIAACGNLGARDAVVVEPVVITVQVQPDLFRRDLPRAEAMAEVLKPASILEMVNGDGVSLVHLDRGGDSALPKGDPKYWRGAMNINGSMVGLAMYAPKGSALAGRQGKGLILQLAENLREYSPTPD